MGNGVDGGSWQRIFVIRSDGTRNECQKSKPIREPPGIEIIFREERVLKQCSSQNSYFSGVGLGELKVGFTFEDPGAVLGYWLDERWTSIVIVGIGIPSVSSIFDVIPHGL